jgi:flagellar motor protein MotB
MKTLAPLVLLLTIFSSCVPRSQYEALATERNYYRNQAAAADSLADLQAISSYDEVDVSGTELSNRIRQVESLTATNIALNNSYQSLEQRYEALLSQSKDMLATSGVEVSGLQQSLAERTVQVAAKEEELRKKELNLQAREESIARIEGDYAPAGGGEPQSYGTVSNTGRPPLSNLQNAALKLNTIQSDLSQLMAYLPNNSYSISTTQSNRLKVVLAESLLSNDGFSVSPDGQQLLRRMASTLRNYNGTEYSVVGHADGANPNALRAYEDSTDKAINVVQQLINYGLDPSMITAAGKGFYEPVGDNSTTEGRTANRRTDIFITVPE